jgi:hypothetical protein
MPLEIWLTEGPCVKGLPEDRLPLYVGYCYRDDQYNPEPEEGSPLVWRVIDAKKMGTVNSYRLHIGNHGSPLQEAEITRFEYTKEKTTVEFLFEGLPGTLTISNTHKTDSDKYTHGTIDELLDHSYNFFGDGNGNSVHIEAYYKKR